MSKPHVLIVSFPYSSAVGGGERYIEQLVDGLMGRGFVFTLVSSSRAMLATFRARSWDNRALWGGPEPVTKLSVSLFPLTSLFFLPLVTAVLAVFRFSRGTRRIICLSLADKLLATLPARLLGMRVVWVEHLVPGRALISNPYRPLFAALSRLAEVVSVSEAVRSGLAGLGVPRDRIRLVAPGVAVGRLAEAGTPALSVVSRLSKEKNVGLAIRAFALISKEIPDVRLKIFGTGHERDELGELAEGLGVGSKIDFCGYVGDPNELYGGSRALLVPSSRESFGIAALEAMSWGLPVVATKVGGLPELVVDGETGFLTEPDDEKKMAKAALKILRDAELARAMGLAARRRAAEVFPLSKTVSGWETLLK